MPPPGSSVEPSPEDVLCTFREPASCASDRPRFYLPRRLHYFAVRTYSDLVTRVRTSTVLRCPMHEIPLSPCSSPAAVTEPTHAAGSKEFSPTTVRRRSRSCRSCSCFRATTTATTVTLRLLPYQVVVHAGSLNSVPLAYAELPYAATRPCMLREPARNVVLGAFSPVVVHRLHCAIPASPSLLSSQRHAGVWMTAWASKVLTLVREKVLTQHACPPCPLLFNPG